MATRECNGKSDDQDAAAVKVIVSLSYGCGAVSWRDGEDDELGGPQGSEADLDVDATVVDVGLSHRGGIAFYEEGLLRMTTLQGALLP